MEPDCPANRSGAGVVARLSPRRRRAASLESRRRKKLPRLPPPSRIPVFFTLPPMPHLPSLSRPLLALFLAGLLSALQGCAVVAVADAAVTVAATGVKITAKAVGAVADAVIPDSD